MDHRTRQDQVEQRNVAFKEQLADNVEAYLKWFASLGDLGYANNQPPPSSRPLQDWYMVEEIDVFTIGKKKIPLREGDCSVSSALLHVGLVPCSPLTPTVAVTVRTLELFRNASLRCPHLAIQPFIKSLCDMHGMPFRPYLTKQFSICFDLYLSIRQEVDSRVQVALGREGANWRLKHACPACTHKLEDEPELEFSMLFCMDGNNSVKRIPCQAPGVQKPEDDDITVGVNNERPDSRKVEGDYYLSRKIVDRWSKESIDKLLLEPGFEVRKVYCVQG